MVIIWRIKDQSIDVDFVFAFIVAGNDGNNNTNMSSSNDVVYFKGWLNYAKLPFDSSSSKKSGKKNWNKGQKFLSFVF